jgi:hypothetical protein
MTLAAKQRIQFDQATAAVCLNNGLTKHHDVNEIDTLEMCHFNLASPSITGVSQFKNLTSLSIVAQDIQEMTGLEGLVHLEQLWVCETKVTRICGLEKLNSLVKLFL